LSVGGVIIAGCTSGRPSARAPAAQPQSASTAAKILKEIMFRYVTARAGRIIGIKGTRGHVRPSQALASAR
jgi:hypothetical protein